MRSYELILVLKASLSETNRKKVIDAIKALLDVKIIKEQDWGQKPLSYSIKKEIAGYYVDIIFELAKEIPKDFKKKLSLNENILRYLLLRKS